MKYIDAEKLKKIIDNLYPETCLSEEATGFYDAIDKTCDVIDSLQQEQESVAEQFAKIVRANLSEIGKDAQSQFEQLYLEITGNKMYEQIHKR